MKLFLASYAIDPDTVNELTQYVGGFKGKSIAYIPTASNGELPWEEWKNGNTWKVLSKLPANIELVQLEDYKNPTALDHLKGKDVIWFGGGFTGYLMYWARRCGLDKALPDLLKAGALYVGSSAGAMAASSYINTTAWFPDEDELGAEVIPGFGLVDFDIYPHYKEDALPYIKSHYTGKKMYLLKNGEEIIVEDDKVQVVGEERIISGTDQKN